MAAFAFRSAVVLAATAVGFHAVPAAADDGQSVSAPSEENLQLSRKLLARYLPVDPKGGDYVAILRGIVAQGGPTGASTESPELKAIFDDFVDGTVIELAPVYARHMPNIVEVTARAYARAYSAAELRQMILTSQASAPSWAELGDPRVAHDKKVVAATRALAAEAEKVMLPHLQRLSTKMQGFAENNPEQFASPGCGTPSSETIAEMMDGWKDEPARS